MELISRPELTRQWKIIPVETLNTPITIIGAGAIGSHAALQLAKMGMMDITVWDHDTVSIENMNCQGYRAKDIGTKKVVALHQIVDEFTGTSMTIVPSKWEPSPLVTKGIVILAVDSMETRKLIFEQIAKDHYAVKKIIDPRMGAETALMYVANPFDEGQAASYRKSLYTDAQAVPEPCTARSTIYTASILSGLVVQAVKDIITGNPYAKTTQYDIGQKAMTQWKSQ